MAEQAVLEVSAHGEDPFQLFGAANDAAQALAADLVDEAGDAVIDEDGGGSLDGDGQSIGSQADDNANGADNGALSTQSSPGDLYAHAAELASECADEYKALVDKVVNVPDPADGARHRLRELARQVISLCAASSRGCRPTFQHPRSTLTSGSSPPQRAFHLPWAGRTSGSPSASTGSRGPVPRKT